MRIWLVNRFYWPDEPATAQLLGDLAEALAARGHEVHVLASRSAVSGGNTSAARNGVFVHRIPAHPLPGGSLPSKAAAFCAFLLGALGLLSLRLRRGDQLIALTDPPLLGFIAWLACALRGARLHHWIQDIHPEVALRLLSAPLLRAALLPLLPLRNFALRRAHSCVAPSASMADFVSEITRHTPPARLLHNWAPAGLAPLAPADSAAARAALGIPTAAFVLMYSGNLGRVHDMDSLAALIARLSPRLPHLLLLIVGSGAGLTALRQACTRLHIPDHQILFAPPAPRKQLAASLSCADLHLVTLRPECHNLVFPSKVYGICAVARPLIALGPDSSDLLRLVRAHGLGLAATPDSLEPLVESLLKLAEEAKAASVSATPPTAESQSPSAASRSASPACAATGTPSSLCTLGASAHAFLRHSGDAESAAQFWESLLATPHKAPACSVP